MTTAVSLKLTPANPPSAGKTELTVQENMTESESVAAVPINTMLHLSASEPRIRFQFKLLAGRQHRASHRLVDGLL